jgi:hypothetical protein
VTTNLSSRQDRPQDAGVSPSATGPAPSGLSQSALSQAEPLVPNAALIADKAWRDAGFDGATNWEAENMIFMSEVIEGELRRLPDAVANARVKASAMVQKAIRATRANSRWWDGLQHDEKLKLRFGLERVTASAIEAATAGETPQSGSTEGESAVDAEGSETPKGSRR